MTHHFVFGADEAVARFVCERIPWCSYHPTMRAIGVATGDQPEDRMIAGIIYHNWVPPQTIRGTEWYNTIEVTFAAANPRFATRGTITKLLNVPFNQYKVRQVLVSVPSINERALRFVKGIGFTSRGMVAHYYAKGIHAHVLGLHRDTFKAHFLTKETRRSRPDEQQRPIFASAAAASA